MVSHRRPRAASQAPAVRHAASGLLLRQSVTHESPQVLLRTTFGSLLTPKAGMLHDAVKKGKSTVGKDGAHGEASSGSSFPSMRVREPHRLPAEADVRLQFVTSDPQMVDSQTTHQEWTVSGLSYCKRHDTKTRGSADGKLSTGHWARMWGFVGVLLLFFPHKRKKVNNQYSFKGPCAHRRGRRCGVLISAPSPRFPR